MTLDPVRVVPEINLMGSACGRSLRPGLAGFATFAGPAPRRRGLDTWIVTAHLDSGTTARDHAHRIESVDAFARLGALLSAGPRDADAVVLGDLEYDGMCGLRAGRRLGGRGGRSRSADRGGRSAARAAAGERRVQRVLRLAPRVARLRPRSSRARGAPSGRERRDYGPCARLSCGRPTTAMRSYLDVVSDHCPLVVSLRNRDLDP